MPKKRHTPEQVFNKLREADAARRVVSGAEIPRDAPRPSGGSALQIH